MKTFPWSQNKWLTYELTVNSYMGRENARVDHEITYQKIGTFAFPVEMISTTTQNLIQPTAQKKDHKNYTRTNVSKLKFSNYRVNTKLAGTLYNQMSEELEKRKKGLKEGLKYRQP